MENLWFKGTRPEEKIHKFTTGNDHVFDLMIAEWDIVASLAHAKMLLSSGLLTVSEFNSISDHLSVLLTRANDGTLEIDDETEDIHSLIENELTLLPGEPGRKIHTGRSRNDQVLVATRLFVRSKLSEIAGAVVSLANKLLSRAESSSIILLPGYTHTQAGMLSSFGLWFASFAESLADDLVFLKASWDLNNRNPLGTAAGYGTSLPVNRELTTSLLDFDGMADVSPYAQFSRGKIERCIADSLSAIAFTIGKMASEMILFLSQNFRFISLPENLFTGSSIMPQKKNPDVIELIRSRCNRLQAIPNEISLVTVNLISGYHRDFQLLKEILFPALTGIIELVEMTEWLVGNVIINKEILNDPIYNPLLATEYANSLVKKGIPFREAYKRAAAKISDHDFQLPGIESYTHTGSIGNPGFENVAGRIKSSGKQFDTLSSRSFFTRILKQ